MSRVSSQQREQQLIPRQDGAVRYPVAMDAELRPCPFCAHETPIVVTIAGDPPVNIVACPECGASGPKQLPGVEVSVAADAWNRRYGAD
jgi:transcription elongation factor Elf1